MSETDERVIVDFDQAVAMLPDGNYIHTFRQAGPALIGANWSREKMLNWLKAHPVELAGSMATAMKHGLVGSDDHGQLFIATKPQEASAV